MEDLLERIEINEPRMRRKLINKGRTEGKIEGVIENVANIIKNMLQQNEDEEKIKKQLKIELTKKNRSWFKKIKK